MLRDDVRLLVLGESAFSAKALRGQGLPRCRTLCRHRHLVHGQAHQCLSARFPSDLF